MIEREAGPESTTHVTAATPFNPPGTAWPYTAISAPSVKRKNAITKDPVIITSRRGNRSIQMRAGMVMPTLMTYWIEAATRVLLPVRPAIEKIYTI